MAKWVPVDTGAEAFVELLSANGVDCIFLNPGSDTVPIQEALAKFRTLGKRHPEIILCPHEQVAMAAVAPAWGGDWGPPWAPSWQPRIRRW